MSILRHSFSLIRRKYETNPSTDTTKTHVRSPFLGVKTSFECSGGDSGHFGPNPRTRRRQYFNRHCSGKCISPIAVKNAPSIKNAPLYSGADSNKGRSYGSRQRVLPYDSAPQAPKIFKNAPSIKNAPPYWGSKSNKGGILKCNRTDPRGRCV